MKSTRDNAGPDLCALVGGRPSERFAVAGGIDCAGCRSVQSAVNIVDVHQRVELQCLCRRQDVCLRVKHTAKLE